MDALSVHNTDNLAIFPTDTEESLPSRLRKQMQANSLQPIHDEQPMTNKKPLIPTEDQYSHDDLEEATQFLRLQVRSFPQIE